LVPFGLLETTESIKTQHSLRKLGGRRVMSSSLAGLLSEIQLHKQQRKGQKEKALKLVYWKAPFTPHRTQSPSKLPRTM
jgi:hypothetical protein